ncbi:MAG: hypothetical protein ABSA83_09965 [Verrucomicrobiota bacterium]
MNEESSGNCGRAKEGDETNGRNGVEWDRWMDFMDRVDSGSWRRIDAVARQSGIDGFLGMCDCVR